MNLPLACQQLRLALLLDRQQLPGVLPQLVSVRVALRGLWRLAAMAEPYPEDVPATELPRTGRRVLASLLEYQAAVELGREDAIRGSLPAVARAVEGMIAQAADLG